MCIILKYQVINGRNKKKAEALEFQLFLHPTNTPPLVIKDNSTQPGLFSKMNNKDGLN